MSIGEKLYLVLVVSMFTSFVVLTAILSWLDSRQDKARRHTRSVSMTVKKPGVLPLHATAHR
jgi:hypothetical protein